MRQTQFSHDIYVLGNIFCIHLVSVSSRSRSMSASYCSQMIKRSKYSYLTKSFIHFLKKISFFVFFIFYQQSGSTLSASELSWNHSSDKPLMLTTHFPDRWKALKTVRLQSNQLVSKWIKVLQGEVSFWCFILRTH